VWIHTLNQRINGEDIIRVGDIEGLDLLLALLERFARYGPIFPCWVESVWVEEAVMDAED